MKYRTTEILDATDLGGAGTKVIDLRGLDAISRINIGYRITMATNAQSAHLAANLSRIEIVDGSKVLWALSGYEAQALGIYNRRVNTLNHGYYVGANGIYGCFPIDFGRKRWDKELAFIPSRFANPQLKITHDETTCDSGAGTNEMEIWADVFDEKVISPIGFLSAKEHYQYTCGDENSYKTLELPTDMPIRKMLLRGYRSQYEPWNALIQARLQENSGKREVFDYDLEDYYRIMKGQWLPVIEQMHTYAAGSATYFIYVTPTDYLVSPVGTPNDSLVFRSPGNAKGGYIPVVAEGGCFIVGLVMGWLPHHCWEFPFGDPDDLDDWYDVTEKEDVKLRLKAGAGGTSGTGEVVLEQLLRY